MTGAATAAALLRYRVMAYVTGTVLMVNCLVSVPLQIAGHPQTVQIVGPIHGFLYLVYLFVAADLTRRMRWPVGPLLWVILAGLVPFAAFVVERRVTRLVQREAGRTWLPGSGSV